jgi:hypothetical protein
VLLNTEKKWYQNYSLDHDRASRFPWAVLYYTYAGWYPVNPDGTEVTPPPTPKRLPRPRVLRRRFPLARGTRPSWK